MLENYTDNDKSVSLRKGDVVEILDTENAAKWLVRQADCTDKVYYFIINS